MTKTDKRKKIPSSIEADVLEKSGRRCCLCYVLDRDYEEKGGQIAHLDGNRNNNAITNLAFLCLPHHNVFDSTTSQSKNYSTAEVKRYRKSLEEIVAQLRNRHLQELMKISSSIKTTPKPKIRQKGKDALPPLQDVEFIAYYSNETLFFGEKTNINFKFRNNTDNTIQCISYLFEGYKNTEQIAKYNRHPFNLLLKPKEEKSFPFSPVNPIADYFKNNIQRGDLESKIYIEYKQEGSDRTKLIIGVARINIS